MPRSATCSCRSYPSSNNFPNGKLPGEDKDSAVKCQRTQTGAHQSPNTPLTSSCLTSRVGTTHINLLKYSTSLAVEDKNVEVRRPRPPLRAGAARDDDGTKQRASLGNIASIDFEFQGFPVMIQVFEASTFRTCSCMTRSKRSTKAGNVSLMETWAPTPARCLRCLSSTTTSLSHRTPRPGRYTQALYPNSCG